jgi:hypothetical protein
MVLDMVNHVLIKALRENDDKSRIGQYLLAFAPVNGVQPNIALFNQHMLEHVSSGHDYTKIILHSLVYKITQHQFSQKMRSTAVWLQMMSGTPLFDSEFSPSHSIDRLHAQHIRQSVNHSGQSVESINDNSQPAHSPLSSGHANHLQPTDQVVPPAVFIDHREDDEDETITNLLNRVNQSAPMDDSKIPKKRGRNETDQAVRVTRRSAAAQQQISSSTQSHTNTEYNIIVSYFYCTSMSSL